MIKKIFSKEIHNIRVSPRELLKLKTNAILSNFNSLIPSPKRDFQVFCIGLPRSGTHTLGYLFNKNFRAEHEPNYRETIINILDWEYGKYNKSSMLKALAFRDKRLQLDLEATHFLHHIAALLVELFPKAKFILTVREPMSWLESEINQNHQAFNNDAWLSLQHFRYSRYNYEHEFDQLTNIDNLYPIRSYFSYWKDHISTVLNDVPKDRLLVIDTFDLLDEINQIAAFVGVDSNLLDLEKKWSGKRKPILSLYEHVNQNEVRKLMETHCGDFINESFPQMAKYLN